MSRRLTNVCPYIFLAQLNVKLIHPVGCRELKSGEKSIGLNATHTMCWWCTSYDHQDSMHVIMMIPVIKALCNLSKGMNYDTTKERGSLYAVSCLFQSK